MPSIPLSPDRISSPRLRLQRGALFAAVTLLAGGRTLAMRYRGGVLRMGLYRSRFSLSRMFRFGSCCRVLLMSSVTHRGGRVCFVGAFRRFLFLFFFLSRCLDAGELSQDFFTLFLGLAAAGELHGEDLLDDLIEFCPARHAQRFEFGGHNRKSDANRAPFVEKSANLREGRRFIGLSHQVGDLIERHFLEEPESIDGGIHLAPHELLLSVQRFLLKAQRGL